MIKSRAFWEAAIVSSSVPGFRMESRSTQPEEDVVRCLEHTPMFHRVLDLSVDVTAPL